MANIKIESNGALAHIYIDGEEVSDVRRYSIKHSGGELPVFTLDVMASEITLDGDGFVPALPEAFRPYYKYNVTSESPKEQS